MEQILSSGEQRRDLGTRGLRRSADFTLENFVRQVLLVYESLA
jgi:hypothetical protein